jgi:hypothetical protein
MAQSYKINSYFRKTFILNCLREQQQSFKKMVIQKYKNVNGCEIRSL